MKKALLSLFGILAYSLVFGQDFKVTDIYVYNSLNPPQKAPNDSVAVGDTVGLGVEFYNVGSNLLGPNDSVACGFSVNGFFIGNYGKRGIGVNSVPGTSFEVIVHDSLVLTMTGTARICSWPSYTPLGGDPNKSNDTACKNFTVYTLPGVRVNSFAPTEGYRGSEVTLDGNNFDPIAANNTVKIGSINCAVKSATATKLTITLPSNAVTGKFSVTTAGKTSTSSQDFTVRIPTINSFIPDSGFVGDTIQIRCTDVITRPLIRFNGVKAQYVVLIGDTVTTKVPVGATTGKVLFDVVTDSAISASDFVVKTKDTSSSQIEIIEVNNGRSWIHNSSLYMTEYQNDFQVSIYDLTGALVKQMAFTPTDVNEIIELDVSELKDGYYIVRINEQVLKVLISH